MKIHFDHTKNRHSVMGAKTALVEIFGKKIPKSVLDVGCGIGTWLKAFEELGTIKIEGIDGEKIPENQLLIRKDRFSERDLTKSINLKRKYDLVLCLEVGEHLHKKDANTMIRNLTRHGDAILFSAACPGQGGQNHINCQWPIYWQEKFNINDFECFDYIRKKIWNCSEIEPWYRQNIFLAKKSKKAGKEPRLNSLMHPEIFSKKNCEFDKNLKLIEKGSKPTTWYLKIPIKAIYNKIKRNIKY